MSDNFHFDLTGIPADKLLRPGPGDDVADGDEDGDDGDEVSAEGAA